MESHPHVKNWIHSRVHQKLLYIYLTRHIYIRYDSGDLNDVGTKKWGFFLTKTAKFRTPN